MKQDKIPYITLDTLAHEVFKLQKRIEDLEKKLMEKNEELKSKSNKFKEQLSSDNERHSYSPSDLEREENYQNPFITEQEPSKSSQQFNKFH